MGPRRIALLLTIALAAAGIPALGAVSAPDVGAATPTVQHLHYEFGPVHLDPGQNIIQYSGGNVPKPTQAGWITGIRPNLILTNGTIPPVDIIHLHHAVWLNLSRSDMSYPSIPERFFATGEEKTALRLPAGYGYRYEPTDQWLLNYMLHVLVNQAFDVKVTYDLDFVPATTGVSLRSVHPIWLDVQNGSAYPVFDARAGTGTAGQYTYPTQAANPYGGGPAKNRFTMPTGGVLVATAGHLHPGGLHTDLNLARTRAGRTKTAHLFRSNAVYYEPAGPVSWDVSMTATPASWKVRVRPGDVLSTTATYDTTGWSWYEVMGIMVVWYSPRGGGKSPFRAGIDAPGTVTHGHLSENDNHGGGVDPDLPDPSGLANGPLTSTVGIVNFEYEPGDLDLATSVPTLHAGSSLQFVNYDAPSSGYGTWHTITTCKLPCNRATGIAYPTANAPLQLDSGQLGNAGAPTAGRRTWPTPANLPVGDYAYFCRVHPFMRGAFRVVAG